MSVRSLRYNTIEQHFTKGVTASTDRDALAFLEAAQIYNTNQQRAIVNLVRSLKRVGLWSKMKAIYPFVGGTATTHKWNLKDPRDVDAAYRLQFNGGWTHSSNGADPNGTTGYANSYLPVNTMGQNSLHMSAYLRENTLGTFIDMGAIESSTNNANTPAAYFLARLANPTSNVYGAVNASNGVTNMNPTTTTSLGMTQINRISSTEQKIFRNGSQLAAQTMNSIVPNTLNVYLGACNFPFTSGGIDYYSNRQFAFATIGDGLTDSDATNLYNIVDLYQKRLGRAV